MLAAAYLAATRATEHARPAEKGGSEASRRALIPLSINEIRHLLTALVLTPLTCTDQVLHWSRWRREHQHQARACHYRRRGERPPD